MFTDPWPRTDAERREYARSDGLLELALPEPGPVRAATAGLFLALGAESAAAVRRAGVDLAGVVAEHFRVVAPEVRVLGVRPHRVEGGTCTYQLYGDYAPDDARIRVWMRTAIREKVCSPRAFLATLLHEICHHLDCRGLDLPGSFHTRGFYGRVDALYHHALATPPEARRPLHWVRTGRVWRIDWSRSRVDRPPGGHP